MPDDRVILVRHARAEDEHPEGDHARALTAEGRAAFRAHARRLAKALRVQRIVTSPLVRAVQTAELLAAACGIDQVTVDAALIPHPDGTRRLVALAKKVPSGTALVGHNPAFADAAAVLLGMEPLPFKFKKGGALVVRRAAGAGAFELFHAPGKRPRTAAP